MNSTAPSRRKCTNGSRTNVLMCAAFRELFHRGVPDRRGVSTLLKFHRGAGQRLDPEAFGVISGPTWRGNLQHAHVVKRALSGIEVRVFPNGDQFRIANGVGPGGVFNVHCVADGWQLAVRAQLALIRVTPDDVIDLLADVARGIEPAFA